MLKVLKGFREGGKDYRPGDDAPVGLHPDKRDQLIRARHLYDPKAKSTPRPKNELQVAANPKPSHVEWRDIDGIRTPVMVPDTYEEHAPTPVKYGHEIITSKAVRH